MANPDPEIRPELIQDVAAVIATGRSDFPNQINNVLAFPGVFRGALDAGATQDHREHEGRRGPAPSPRRSAPTSWRADYIIPSVFDPEVVVGGGRGLRRCGPRRRRLPLILHVRPPRRAPDRSAGPGRGRPPPGQGPPRVVGTGVDPVTYRFSGGRSAN